MIIDEAVQGSDEWLMARLGCASASQFDKIMSAGLKPSTQSEVYQNKLVGEWYVGEPESIFVTEAMQRGTDMEPEAREAFSFITGREVTQHGFIYLNDEKLVGASPDGLTDDSGLEIKCCLPSTHVGMLIANKVPSKYIGQVQGSMMVTGRDSWAFCAYCPGFPPLIIDVPRDDKWHTAFKPLLDKFIDGMMKKRERIVEICGERT